MNKNLHALLFIIITSSLIMAACNTRSPVVTEDIQGQGTQTMEALATIVQLTMQAAVPTVIPPTDTPVPTNTAQPTQTPLPTEALTPTQTVIPSDTPTAAPSFPTALVNKNTNCRGGPSSAYPIIAVILSNEEVKIISRTTLSDYVLVENPQKLTQSCWLWTKYATIKGDITGLPEATPPAPPLNFILNYNKLDTCVTYSLVFEVENVGSTTLQSYTIVAKDLTANTQETTSSNSFSLRKGCTVETEIGFVDPGKVGYVYANDFSFNPTGHSMEATVTVCSNDDRKGICVTQVIRFTP